MIAKVIAIVGPTASGKSSLGVFLAKKFNGEVISADSRQVYRGLDVGTGKITKKEMQGVPHHLLDVANPKKQFTVSDFVQKGETILNNMIYHIPPTVPIVVGGTGFYIDSLLGRIILPHVPPNPALRARLEKKTVEELFAQLKRLDPERAKTIEPKHKRRIIRALEIAKYRLRSTTSTRALRRAQASPTLASSNAPAPLYDILWLGISPDAKKLKTNIHKRLIVRMKDGMVAEAKRLHAKGLTYKRMNELGLEYRSLARFLLGEVSEQEMLMELERAILHYAKRQIRWFRRNKDITWVKNQSEALRLAKAFISS